MTMVTDPVCGRRFDSSEARAHTTYDGQEYSFCSEECRLRFERSPDDVITVGGVTTTSDDEPPSETERSSA